MKISLVAINTKFNQSSPVLYSLEKSLANLPIETEKIAANINEPYLDILARIYNSNADIVAIATYLWNVEIVQDLVCDLKKVKQELQIILGGPEFTSWGEKYLVANPNIDFIIEGEGEIALPTLVNTLISEGDMANCPSLVYRNNGRVLCNAPAKYINMDTLPPLYTDEELGELENHIVYYESSRGCPFNCAFCCSANEKIRFASVAKVENDLKLMLKHKIRTVKFVDRTFNANDARTIELLKMMSQMAQTGTTFHLEIDPRVLSNEVINILNTAPKNCFQIECGIQSTCTEALEAINKKVDFEKLKISVKQVLAGDNIHVHLDLIAGLPKEGMSEFAKSFSDVISLDPHYLQLGFLKMLHGSPLEGENEKWQIQTSAKPPYEVLSTPWLSFDDLICLKSADYAIDIFYNDGKFKTSLHLAMENWQDELLAMFIALGQFAENEISGKPNENQKYVLLQKFYKLNFPTIFEQIQDALRFDWYRKNGDKRMPEELILGEQDSTIIDGVIENIEEVLPELLGVPRHKWKSIVRIARFNHLNNQPNTLIFFLQREKQGVFDYYQYEILA